MVESEQRPEQFLDAAEGVCKRILKKEEKHVDDAPRMKTGMKRRRWKQEEGNLAGKGQIEGM